MKLTSDNGDFCKFREVKCLNLKVGLTVQRMSDKQRVPISRSLKSMQKNTGWSLKIQYTGI